MQDKKILIVGGGIAGLTLAYRLFQRHLPFEIWTKQENHSSSVAAGLMIPIVFRRTTKSWRIDEFLPKAEEFYTNLEQKFGVSLWHPVKIRRSFSHEQEREDWLKKKQDPSYAQYLGDMNTTENANIYHEFGTGIVEKAAWVDGSVLLPTLTKFFEDKNCLRYQNFSFAPENLQKIKATFEKIVFCEGYELIHNPFFNYLPLDPTKGQVLVIESDEISETESINRKCFVLPIGNRQFKVGSTYEWHDSTLNATNEAREELENHLKSLISARYDVVQQLVGVRPTVKDRRPLLGQHPTEKQLYVLNGFGTKGYLLSPAMTEQMADLLQSGKELDAEISIKRCKKLD